MQSATPRDRIGLDNEKIIICFVDPHASYHALTYTVFTRSPLLFSPRLAQVSPSQLGVSVSQVGR